MLRFLNMFFRIRSGVRSQTQSAVIAIEKSAVNTIRVGFNGFSVPEIRQAVYHVLILKKLYFLFFKRQQTNHPINKSHNANRYFRYYFYGINNIARSL